MRYLTWLLIVGVCCGTVAAEDVKRTPIILDTDIGTNIDDALALAAAIASPQIELVGVTSSGGNAGDRAWMACRFLTQSRVQTMPVAIGQDPQPEGQLDWQIQYRRHPAALYNRTMKPTKDGAVALLRDLLKQRPGELTIVCTGPLNNVMQLLAAEPDAKKLIRQIVVAGDDIESLKKETEKIRAAGIVCILMPAPDDATIGDEWRKNVFSAYKPITWQLQNLYELWEGDEWKMSGSLAVCAVAMPQAFEFSSGSKAMSPPATLRIAKPKDIQSVQLQLAKILRGHGEESLPPPPQNSSKFIERGLFPNRVHTFEDYDTDIEKRWWMSGKAETADVPPGGVRANRAVLTQDFDDRQGDTKTMYRAVVFNPVPGPPMGENTRLTFRYKLMGTDTLRVQLYSLSNGYHRYLSLSGVPQNEWRTGTVDMTQMRRPDGSGGPLGVNERIDDIQFFVDPRATVLIDDVVLYDAAHAAESRPFPARVIYTGIFDTGRYGNEWQGNFEIVPHAAPRMWKAAKAVPAENGQGKWIRLYLKGERRLDSKAELSFRYQSEKPQTIKVQLGRGKETLVTTEAPLKGEAWDLAVVPLDLSRVAEQDRRLDEIRIFLAPGHDLLIDDVTLYTPGGSQK